MAAHRYWRVLFKQPNNSLARIAELSLRTVAGGASVATGGTPIASNFVAGSEPAKAFGGTAGYWQPSTGAIVQEWLGYDFGAGHEQDIVEIAIDVNSEIGSTSYIPTIGLIQWSDDNATWTMASPGLAPPAVYGVYVYGPVAAVAVSKVRGQKLRINPGWPSPSVLQKKGRGTRGRLDALDGGPYRIVGTTKIKGTPNAPVSRKVQLFVHAGARVIRETWSDPVTGAYEFKLLKNQSYFVLAFDHTLNYRVVGADQVTPEAMA